MKWYEKLKEKRLNYGVSQNKLALDCGISRQYFNAIENGKQSITNELKEQIELCLEKYNPDCPIEMLFDYVRVRFPTTDVKQIIEGVLQMRYEIFVHEEYAFYGYSDTYYYGDIVLMASPDSDKGVLLELKGKGCRQLENFLLAQKRSWYDFLLSALGEKGVFKRVDLAINDKVGILNIPELAEKCKQEECVSVFRSFKSYGSGELVKRHEKDGMGNTLYIGSLKSEVYFCAYEKDKEQYLKNDVPIEETPVKNRFEIRLKNDRAYFAVLDLLSYRNAEKTAFGIINHYIRFVDKDVSKRRSDWETNSRWALFIGENRKELKLTAQPEPLDLNRTLSWLSHQVAPTLKMVQTLDKANNTTILTDMISQAKLTDKHTKLMAQQVIDVEDVILPQEEV